jgi:hypothetical protein
VDERERVVKSLPKTVHAEPACRQAGEMKHLQTLLTNFTGWRAIIALIVALKVLRYRSG